MEGFIKTTIGGEGRGFKFDIKSMGLILNDLGVGILGLQAALGNPHFSYPIVLFQGAKRAVELDKEEVTFTQEDVYDWLSQEEDNVFSPSVVAVTKAFVDSAIGLMPKPKDKKAKKEQASPNGKKSTGSKT